MRKCAGWSFESQLCLEEMLARLNSTIEDSQWMWRQRQSDTKGPYIMCTPVREDPEILIARATGPQPPTGNNNHIKLRIFENGEKFLLDTLFSSAEEKAEVRANWTEHVKAIHEKILPAIGATNIADADYLD